METTPPAGAFCLADMPRRPVILLSGGVGLTPMVSAALDTGSFYISVLRTLAGRQTDLPFPVGPRIDTPMPYRYPLPPLSCSPKSFAGSEAHQTEKSNAATPFTGCTASTSDGAQTQQPARRHPTSVGR
ncbi:hypothetical protein SPHINGO391_350552 [Sphingomonas aurantiaca]|uniref:Uncharacterized protein n=1 Tax=Sphingomonas aurantiaca TaxID=185949 RepID=A0A5E7YAW0_9SPHN|nr:hypothetical protein SPHINGO391_350552 [Sphingomonas aurantiaca]